MSRSALAPSLPSKDIIPLPPFERDEPMAPEHDERGWPEYRRLILAELERIDKGMTDLNVKLEKALDSRDQSISDLRVSVAMLQVKASLFGGLTGLATA